MDLQRQIITIIALITISLAMAVTVTKTALSPDDRVSDFYSEELSSVSEGESVRFEVRSLIDEISSYREEIESIKKTEPSTIFIIKE